MTNQPLLNKKLTDLQYVLSTFEQCVIAVSGGVDSMLLAYVAHSLQASNSGFKVAMAHAYSPAVPQDAYLRVKQYAKQYGWALTVLDAAELDNPDYVANPVNRCYFCKSNLYTRIANAFSGVPIISGTNTDDLSDYRPGLIAATENHVRHAYVEAGIAKADIYALAKQLNLEGLHTLPAQPCLASRVETGIHIVSDDLLFIDKVEKTARLQLESLGLAVTGVRCRITAQGVFLETTAPLEQVNTQALEQLMHGLCKPVGRSFAGLRAYTKGSAFIHSPVQPLSPAQLLSSAKPKKAAEHE